jgi:hypothetical protein
MTTISLNDKIESQDLNRAFGKANKFYRLANLADSGYFNIRMSFQGIVLDESDNRQTDIDAYQKFFRAPDDIDIVAAIVDLWGVNRMGYNTNNNIQPDSSSGTNFSIKVLGNFTAIDEETGYPQTYKSSEFNIVSDIDVHFDSRDCLHAVSAGTPLTPVLPLSSYPSYLLSQSGLQYPGIIQKSLGGADRDMYYPIEETRPLVSLLRGAQYIFDISHTNKDSTGAPYTGSLTGNQMDSAQDVTSADIVLVCRTTRRRYS